MNKEIIDQQDSDEAIHKQEEEDALNACRFFALLYTIDRRNQGEKDDGNEDGDTINRIQKWI